MSNLVNRQKHVVGLAPTSSVSGVTPDAVKMNNWNHLTIYILVDNGTSPGGSAITLKQGSTSSPATALAFTKAWKNIDVAAGDTLTEFTVSSNTFTTDTTNDKNLLYVIEVDADDLTEGNNWVAVGVGNASNCAASVLYALSDSRYAGDNQPTAIA